MPDNVVDTLRVNIEKDSRAASGDIEALVTELGSLKTALNNLKSVKIDANIVTGKAIENLQALSATLNSFDNEKIQAVSFALDHLSMSLVALQGLKANSFFSAKAGENASAFASAVDSIDMDKIRELSTLDLSNLSTALSVNNLKDYSETLGNIEDGIKATYHLLRGKFAPAQKEVADATNKATAAINTQTKAAHSHHKSFSLASTALGKFFNSVKRIAFYRVIRSAIKAVTQGFSEGVQNMYFWSQAVGTSFAPAMDRLATATAYMKNGFASMWSPLIEAAIPVIDKLIDKFVDFFNLVQEGFARLTKAPTWTKALKYPVTFAENTEGATKAAKALHNVLMGFDELNVINTPTESGRGAAGDEKDYASMFQTMVTSMEEGENFGKRLADALNDFFDGDWEAKGQKFGDFVNKVIENVSSFVDHFDEVKAATAITSFIRGSLERVNFEELGAIVVKIPRKLMNFAFEFIRTFPAAQAGKAIGDFLTGFSNEFVKWAKEFDISEWGEMLEKKLIEFIISINWIRIGTALIRVIASLLGTALDGMVNWIAQRFTGGLHFLGKIADVVTLLTTEEKNPGLYKAASVISDIDDTVTEIEGASSIIKDSLIESVDSWADEIDKTVGADYEKQLEDIRKHYGLISKETTTGLAQVNEAVKAGLEPITSSFNDFMDRLRQKTSDNMYESVNIIETETGKMVMAVDKNGHTVVMTYDEYMKTLNDNTKLSIDNITGYFNVGGKEWYTVIDQNGNETLATYEEIIKAMDKESVDKLNKMRSDYKKAGLDMSHAFDTVPKSVQAWNLWDKASREALAAANGFKSTLSAQFRNYSLNIPATISITNTTSTRGKIGGGATFDMSLMGFASGGYTPSAQMFYAGENGVPEIMGKVNGRSAVVGSGEITGISDTIRAQGAREERLLETLIAVLQSKDFSFTPNAQNGRAINQALKAYGMVTG